MMGSVDYKAVRQQKKIECRKYAEEIRKNEATVVQKQNSVLGLKKNFEDSNISSDESILPSTSGLVTSNIASGSETIK